MPERRLVWKSVQCVARILTTVLFDLKVYGLENIPRRGGALIVCNHQSFLDPIAMNVRLRRPLSYLAKAELFQITPLFTALLYAVGAFPVNQGVRDVGAVRQSIRRLREGRLLNLYPEGSRTQDGEIGRIEKGVALIDRRARVPVIPAIIDGAFEALPWNRSLPRFHPIRIQFGAPMNLADLDADQIVQEVDCTLRTMFDEMREERNGNHRP